MVGTVNKHERVIFLNTTIVLVNALVKKRKFPFKRKACQVYRVKYGRGRIW